MLSTFIHVRYVDLSKNNLKDISALNSLTHMLTLKVDDNKLTSAKLEVHFILIMCFFYASLLSFSGNAIPSNSKLQRQQDQVD